jgi:sulfur dioxygenase
MIFRQLFDAPSSTYTYLLACPRTRQAALIDPVKSTTGLYLQLLDELDLRLRLVIDTHTHADHITAAGDLRDATGASTYLGQQAQSTCASEALQDGARLSLGDITLEVMHTPGHTDDSYSLVVQQGEQTWAFTGDTLLIRGTGRTDFQNGDAQMQYQSLFERLLTLPDNTWVYPGHDYKGWTRSTIGEEKAHNPRLQVQNAAEYAAIMGALKLTNPQLMDLAVPANRACGKST